MNQVKAYIRMHMLRFTDVVCVFSAYCMLGKRAEEVNSGKKKWPMWKGWVEVLDQTTIWRGGWCLGWDGNISLLFSSLLSHPVYCICISYSTPPLHQLLREFGRGKPSSGSRWPSPEPPLSPRRNEAFHAMHYLKVNGFVLAGTALVNGHHYSFITAGTGWNETSRRAPATTWKPAMGRHREVKLNWMGSTSILVLHPDQFWSQFSVCEWIQTCSDSWDTKYWHFVKLLTQFTVVCMRQTTGSQASPA